MERYTRDNPCPICGGWGRQERGQGKRCWGYVSADKQFAYCVRDEHAGGIEKKSGADAYAHWLWGPCYCGADHGGSVNSPAVTDHEAIYPYEDPDGKLLAQFIRDPGKKFWWRRPDGAGGWIKGMGDVWIMYRLRELLTDKTDRPIYIVEGEKDVEILRKKGHLATCNPNGAGKFPAAAWSAWKAVEGRDVVIIADADKKGRDHALNVQANLIGYPRSIRVYECPVPHKDVHDLLSGGGDLGQLIELQLDMPDATEKPAETKPVDDIRASIVWAPQLAEPLPPIAWVSEGLTIAPGRPTILAGEGGTRKGWFAMAMQVLAAGNMKLFGKYAFKNKLKSLYVDYEQGKRMTSARFQALCRGYSLNFAELDIGYCWRPVPSLAPKNDNDRIKARDALCRLTEGIDLVIIDSVRACSPGIEENGVFASAPLDLTTDVSERTGTAFGFIDHAGKPPKDPQEGGRSRKHAQRGHSSKLDAAQTLFVFSSSKGQPTLVTCERSQIVAEERWPGDLQFTLLSVQGGIVLSESAVASADDLIDERTDQECERLVTFLTKQGGRFLGSQSHLYTSVGGNEQLFYRAMNRLKTSGKVQIAGSRGNHEIVLYLSVVTTNGANTSNTSGALLNTSQGPTTRTLPTSPPYRGEVRSGSGGSEGREHESQAQAEEDADQFYMRPEKEWGAYTRAQPWGQKRIQKARAVATERIRSAMADADVLKALLARAGTDDIKAAATELDWPERRLRAAAWILARSGWTPPPETPPTEATSDVRMKSSTDQTKEETGSDE